MTLAENAVYQHRSRDNKQLCAQTEDKPSL